LAGLAIPVLTDASKNAYKAEAISTLGLIRRSMIQYYSKFNTYPEFLDGERFSDVEPVLGIDIDQGGQTLHWEYDPRRINGTTFLWDATPKSGSDNPFTQGLIRINERGEIFDNVS
jgi:hypothetical protein